MARDVQILFLNGSSGSGKTTIAARLKNDHQIAWFHPDGAWDTTRLDQRELTFRCVEKVVEEYNGLVIIDSQLQNQFLVDSVEKYRVSVGKQILLDCNDAERESRLLKRGWSKEKIAPMIPWAQYLREQAIQEKVLLVDTSSASELEVVGAVLDYIVEMGGV
jgi:broad-specificity NMP kinase